VADAGARLVRNLVVPAPGQLVVEEVEEPPLAPGQFRVDTRYSGVSAGTELTWYRGTSPWLSARWDARLGLFRPAEGGTGYPVRRLGYMEVAQVVASRTPAVREGETVTMTYGHRTGYTADAVEDRVTRLPAELDPLLGVYAAHLGPICANGLLHAAADLAGRGVRTLGDGVRGRDVLVVGAGVIGLLTGLWARHLGAASVSVVDRTTTRLQAASALGLSALDERAVDPAEVVKTALGHGPGDRGVSVAFQCRGQAGALATALRCLRPQGTVIDLAYYTGGADEVRLGEEFHHNGLTVRSAQIGRVPRGLAGEWDRARLSADTLELLGAYGDVIRRTLVTDLVAFDDAPALFADVSDRRRHVLTAVLTC